MFLVVLSLCLASSLAKPSIGYSYSAYAPLSYSSYSYAPYQSLLNPYSLKSSYAYAAPTVYAAAPAPVVTPHVVAPVVHSAPSAYVEATGLKTQYHTQDGYGQASYGHSEPHQSHNAVQDAAGNKIGSFSYVKPDGHVHRTDYVADAAGYRVASNDLPVGPAAAPAPAVVPVPVHDSPVIVESPTVPAETPEVIAAKVAHFAAHAAARHSLYKRSIYGYAPAPVVTPSGHLADTPEVAAAKAAHFAEHAKRGNYYAAPYYHSGYYGPYASPVVTPSGYLADTPEVAAAKAAHFAEKAKVSHHYNAIPYAAPYSSYAAPVITPSGHVADTPEVAAAKAAHFAEHAAAAARNAAASHHVSPAYSYAPYAPYVPSHYAAPVVTPSGYLADTPEVAHAKAAHLAEHAAVASRQKRSAVLLGHTPASTVPLAPVAYAAPSYAYPHSYAYAAAPAPLAYPYSPSLYSAFPYLKPATHTTVVHGPHAVSYQVA
jgi:hypothetical protein